MSSTTKVGIVGAAGYSGEELVRILLQHPNVSLELVSSRTHAGKPLADIIPYVRNQCGDLCFSLSDPQQLAQTDVELFFLALPHGVSFDYVKPLLDAGKKVIDLSADFRLFSHQTYVHYYGHEHPNPELLAATPYVLPELSDSSWKSSPLIACPGCYPTSVLIPMIPLITDNVVSTQNIVINSFSGVSGAGKKLAENFLYSERNESATAYGLTQHRHLSEIEEQLNQVSDEPIVVQFNPHLAPMKRGIITTITVPAVQSLENLYHSWQKYYQDKPFVSILPPEIRPDTKYVSQSNRIDISACHDPRTGNFVITSAEDNLCKGASGQAVQIMNLLLDFPETSGLL